VGIEYIIFGAGVALSIFGVFLFLHGDSNKIESIKQNLSNRSADVDTLKKKIEHIYKEIEESKKSSETNRRLCDGNSEAINQVYNVINKKSDDINSYIAEVDTKSADGYRLLGEHDSDLLKNISRLADIVDDKHEQLCKTLMLEVDLLKQQLKSKLPDDGPVEIIIYDGGKKPVLQKAQIVPLAKKVRELSQ
jgi:chromosome segregation ATPase